MNYCFFDLETTGLARTSDILEFGAVFCDENMNVTDTYNEYFLYYDEVPSGASKVHGLTREKLEFLAERDFLAAASDVFKKVTCKDTMLCGHNILRYDIPVLQTNLSRAGITLNVPSSKCIDTLLLARSNLPGSHKLADAVATAASQTGVTVKALTEKFDAIFPSNALNTELRYHSAMYDAFMSRCLYSLIQHGTY